MNTQVNCNHTIVHNYTGTQGSYISQASCCFRLFYNRQMKIQSRRWLSICYHDTNTRYWRLDPVGHLWRWSWRVDCLWLSSPSVGPGRAGPVRSSTKHLQPALRIQSTERGVRCEGWDMRGQLEKLDTPDLITLWTKTTLLSGIIMSCLTWLSPNTDLVEKERNSSKLKLVQSSHTLQRPQSLKTRI